MADLVLLIQDDADGAAAIREVLEKSCTQRFLVEWVRTGTLGLQRLTVGGRQHAPDHTDVALILVDLPLPDGTGGEIVDRLHAAAPQTPIVVLCAVHDEPVAEAALRRGASDHILRERIDDYVLPKTLGAVIDRANVTEALFNEKERALVTLNSIGDAVISTDVGGNVSYLNSVAERLTGWPGAEALGRPLEAVFRIIDSDTRATIPSPMEAATRQNRTVGLPPTCILIRRDGVESPVEDSSAPIHDRAGRVTGAVMVFRDVSSSRAMSVKLAYYAQHDSLTDLPNRSLLNDRLTLALMAAQRHHMALAVLYLDLDRFKHINDSMGHAAGDRLLQSVALRLTDGVRASDTVSRLGGDEFVVLLPEVAHAEDAAVCAEKLLQSLRQPYVIDGHELHVSVSIGIAIFPGDGADVEALLQNADSAMYEAKGRGRDNYQFYRLDLNSSANHRQTLESGLRHAVARNELELHYQPIINLESSACVGVEALLRWRHPTLGILLPGVFMSIAEESGLIVPIGRWVLREACRQARAWERARLPLLRLSVNISAVELRSKNFVDGVAAILAQTGFAPERLELELTETFLMQDSLSTAMVLNALKLLGVALALDDFGTGYSSLSYMRRFPIDTLKVDRSFVSNLTIDEDDASIVNAVIFMGKSLHMRVVAEGVESLEQASFLKRYACPEAQGYHFSHPVDAAGIARLLRQGTRGMTA
jgi:diguanylate cyclase (GGDEF)-like protein/PAS domain S-box-containing protein